jgi:hypothetical protein
MIPPYLSEDRTGHGVGKHVHGHVGHDRIEISVREWQPPPRGSPEQARQHYLTRRVIRTLMTGTKGRPSVQLGKLAARTGLQVPA